MTTKCLYNHTLYTVYNLQCSTTWCTWWYI